MAAGIRGIGGVFFKSQNPEALRDWYARHLGIQSSESGTTFPCKEGTVTVWCIFPATSKYFDPSPASFMLNYIVDDLAATLDELRANGVTVDSRVETYEYGSFGWITDPDGNRIELWEPKPSAVTNQED